MNDHSLATANTWKYCQTTTDDSSKPSPEGERDEEGSDTTSSHERIDTPDETPGPGKKRETNECNEQSQLDKI